jgi:hypothetical protein
MTLLGARSRVRELSGGLCKMSELEEERVSGTSGG